MPKEQPPESQGSGSFSSKPKTPNIWNRPQLTGDWGGARTAMSKHGIDWQIDFTQFYQGKAAGSGNASPGYSGVADVFLTLDSEKLRLWKGGSFTLHPQFAYGDKSLNPGGVLIVTNTAMMMPVKSGQTAVLTSLFLKQKFGDRYTLTIGKINTIDLAATDPFIGGRGVTSFMNIVFAAPPTGRVPPAILGGIFSIATKPVTWSFWVFDPANQWDKWGQDSHFQNGVSFTVSAAIPAKIHGLTSAHTLSSTFSTKEGVNLADIPQITLPITLPLPPGEIGFKQGTYIFAYTFEQYLKQNPKDSRQGWGLFCKTQLGDKNPGVLWASVMGGVGGTGLFPKRPLDRFGAGYFYYALSPYLTHGLAPLVTLRNEQGGEAFYNFAVTPWLRVTADLQVISPTLAKADTAAVASGRVQLIF
jgi:porin